MTSYGILATVLKFRGSGNFREPISFATHQIKGAALTRAKGDTIFSDETLFNSDSELEEYLKNEVEPYVAFSLHNLADTFTKFKYGNPFTYENSPLPYKRQSNHFKIDFENENILKSLEERDINEHIPFSRSYKHLYKFLINLFKSYSKADASWLPEMGMSQTQFELCKKYLPNSERPELDKNPILLKQRLLDMIVEIIEVIYWNKKPVTNPWFDFKVNIEKYKSENEFILENEKDIIRKFNANVSDLYKIHSEILPSPFMGNVETAPIMLLVLNPGYDPKEEARGFYTKYNDWVLSELTHEHFNIEQPLFSLDEEYKKDSPYWYSKLKQLHEKYGIKAVSNNVCKVQFFPYTTEKYKNIPSHIIKKELGQNYLPSQLYNFWLVKKAIKRGAIIVLTRSKDHWLQAVPELVKYKNLFFTKNARNPTISQNNCPEGFTKMEEVLTKWNKE